jgi:hypothetical protein
VVAPNLLTKPATVMFNKVTIKGAKQAVQMFGPAQRGVAMAVADSVEDGTIPADEADNLFISVGVFIHWLAEDDKKIQDYNYRPSASRSSALSPASRPLPKWWPPRAVLRTRSPRIDEQWRRAASPALVPGEVRKATSESDRAAWSPGRPFFLGWRRSALAREIALEPSSGA